MRMLDLFCGDGLAAWGYWQSGRFGEIVGIDTQGRHKRSYPFDFICKNALDLDYNFLLDFDFIHASPPCQAYSKATPDQSKHQRLILPTIQMLEAAGRPYVVENVEGSSQELRPNIVMAGQYFGLPIERRRYFRVPTLDAARLLRQIPDYKISARHSSKISARHSSKISGQAAANVNIAIGANVHIHESLPRADIIRAMGLDVMPRSVLQKIPVSGMKQGIPPAMTKWLAEAMFSQKFLIG